MDQNSNNFRSFAPGHGDWLNTEFKGLVFFNKILILGPVAVTKVYFKKNFSMVAVMVLVVML